MLFITIVKATIVTVGTILLVYGFIQDYKSKKFIEEYEKENNIR